MSLKFNIATTFVARLAVLALALVSSIFLARILGPEGRGLFALIVLLPEFLTSVGLFGIEQSNMVYAGLEPKARPTLMWQSAAIAGVIGTSVAIASAYYLVLGAPGVKSLVQGPLWLYLLPLSTIPGRIVTTYWWSIIQGMNRIFLLNIVEVGTKVASLVLVLVFIAWLRMGVAGAVWADFAVSIGSVLLMIFLLRHVRVWERPSFDSSLLRRSVRFALPAHGANILTFLNYRVDQFIIVALLPPEQLGFYVIAVGIVERLWILPGSVAGALLPHLTSSHDRNPAQAAIIARHVMIWIGIACFLVFILAGVGVRLLYSSAFISAVAPLRWLLPGIFALSIGKILVAELSARKKIDYVVWAGIIAVLVNVAGNLILIPRMGISGAAIASTMSYSLLSVIIICYYLRETGVGWKKLIPCRGDFLPYLAFMQQKGLFFK